MAFPADPTDLTLGFGFGVDVATDPSTWTYTDVSDYAQAVVVITRGFVGGEQTQAQPSGMDVSVRNTDGDLSPRNVDGPYFGQLRRNLPLQVAVDVGSGPVARGTTLIADYPVRWTGPDIDDRVPLQTDGLLRNLGADIESMSAMRRTIAAPSTVGSVRDLDPTAVYPVVFFPLEDLDGATAAASALAGANPLTGSPLPAFSVDGPVGTLPLADFTDAGQLTASVSYNGLETTDRVTEFVARMAPVSSSTRSWYPVTWLGGGIRWYAELDSVNNRIRVYYEATPGTLTTVLSASIEPDDGEWHHYRVHISTVDGSFLYRDGTLINDSGGSVVSANLQPITQVTVNHGGVGTGELGVGMFAIYDYEAAGAWEAFDGYDGEAAAVRAERLCAEEGVFLDVPAGDSELMGPQPAGTLVDLLEQCEASDEAAIVERLDGTLGFDPHVAWENRAVALTLDYAEGEVTDWSPDDGDGWIVNDSSITRIGGATARFEQTTGPLGTDRSTGVGRKRDPDSLSLHEDAQAYQHASYRVGRGTVDELRFVVEIDLIEHPNLIADWLDCDIGSRIRIVNQPASRVGPDNPDLILLGYQEVLDAATWKVFATLAPYRSYGIFEIADEVADDGEFVGRLAEHPIAAIRTAINSSATTVDFDPGIGRWTTAADDFDPNPKVRLGGTEVVTVSGISTTAATMIGAGTPGHNSATGLTASATTTAALPGGMQAGDVILVFCAAGDTAQHPEVLTAGYELLPIFPETPTVSNVRVYHKVHSGSESNPSVRVQGNSAVLVSAVAIGLRGVQIAGDPADLVFAAPNLANASAQDIAFPAIFPIGQFGCVLLVLAWKGDDYTSVAVSGWTELVEASTTLGSDQSLYVAYQIQTTPALAVAGSLAVTGGGSAISKAATVALIGSYQTATIARSVNGVVRSHDAGESIEVEYPRLLGL